uniref:Fragile histidine triad diadenosine triphosphatase n=1 Tax=Molossus molossus TaxID=27622 RepID=A0A7J8DBC7_MOLMO|nr:fragile histidine triad diadenosine triphosphatase [Molossus molossus]
MSWCVPFGQWSASEICVPTKWLICSRQPRESAPWWRSISRGLLLPLLCRMAPKPDRL